MASQYTGSELQERTLSIIDEARTSKEPIYIVQGGRASVLLINADEYLGKMQALAEFERIYGADNAVRPKGASAAAEPSASVRGRTYAWRCKICGYVEYVDELPDDFVCPLCGVGKDSFERIEVSE